MCPPPDAAPPPVPAVAPRPVGAVTAPVPAATPQRVVLVVDDALDTLRMLCDALAAEGYVVLVARDAQEALQRFEIAVPDGVLLDAVMPGIDGFALCRQLKATPPWSHVPILFMTGLSETEQILQGFDSGGVDYVVKPLRIPEVLARLATHVRNAQATRLAREAVDVVGMGAVVLDGQGRVAWRSPQATRWLDGAFAARPPEDGATWLQSVPAGGEASTPLPDGRRLVARHMGRSGFSESMLLLHLAAAGTAAAPRQPEVPLTPRESEVLSWLAKGKTNRDIADILGMSPRTVNKHLEHIFEKLGVETRTAAAALAGQMLPVG
ncbi:response regulator transcription factor [Xylophilus ampelinus]|uniref:LuxR family two component transcriptional regulator n=1 Tax=Xylophilus ampelinus TaxID=54067 RepID=A0A318SFT1_9BURK|nr:response regulator [Xylophilus ampelinus]MCS4510687.1 response regulator [Xylophilus ampelinus]PYE76377.1 LuxR family two component transcriptional regulator [Xylophilus ampelinus]